MIQALDAIGMGKATGLNTRIGEDLNGRVRVSVKLGMDSEAAEYLRGAILANQSLSQWSRVSQSIIKDV